VPAPLPLSTDPDSWSPPPARDYWRHAEYVRRVAVLPAEDSSTDDERAARPHRREGGAADSGGVPAAEGPPSASTAEDQKTPSPARASQPPFMRAMQPPLSPGVMQRLEVVAAAHQRNARLGAEAKIEVKQEQAVAGLAPPPAQCAPPVAATITAPAALAQGTAAPTMRRAKAEPLWPGEGDTSAWGTGARTARNKRPPRRHSGGA